MVSAVEKIFEVDVEVEVEDCLRHRIHIAWGVKLVAVVVVAVNPLVSLRAAVLP
jgi:hypothetical protein